MVGGDFNTPPDADVTQALTGGLQDAFQQAGRGYGATAVNPYPAIVRIDQIWFSENLGATASWVHKTEHSDHRAVVAEFVYEHERR
ncbi:MAG: endonuclease/exonuclease/phosphatase family protein [Fimbriimonadaceae bacterium]